MTSDEKSDSSCEETVPCNGTEMSHLLISGNEGDTINVAVVLDLTVNLVGKEGFHCVVELILVKVGSDVFHGVMRPVGMLNSMQEAIVLGDPQTVLQGLKIDCGVQAVFGGVQSRKTISIVTTVLLLGQVL